MKNRLSKAIAIFLAFCVAFSGLPFLTGNLEANALAKKKKTPKNITLQAAASGQTQAVLKWNKIKSPSKGYAVFRDGEPLKHYNTKKTAFTDNDLEAGTSYTYQIKTYTKKTVKMWFNKKTEKWQKKKPAKKYRGKSKKQVVYTYKKKSNAVTIHTAGAPAPSTPSDPTDTGDSDSSDSAQKTYTITWANWNGKTIAMDTVKAGEVPSYSGNKPTRPADENTYEFTGWSPAVTAASADVTYTAQFNAVPRYTITWKNWDGTVLRTDTVRQGVKPIYPGTPARPEDDKYTYTFSGWSPAVTAADKNTTYTAQYEAAAKSSVSGGTEDCIAFTVVGPSDITKGKTYEYTIAEPAPEGIKLTWHAVPDDLIVEVFNDGRSVHLSVPKEYDLSYAKITVFYTAPDGAEVSCGDKLMSVVADPDKEGYNIGKAKETPTRIDSSEEPDASGNSTMTYTFYTNGGTNWTKKNYDIAVEDVTPEAYKEALSQLGCNGGLKFNVDYEAYKFRLKEAADEGEVTYGDSKIRYEDGTKVTITIEAGPAVRVVKVFDKKGNVFDYYWEYGGYFSGSADKLLYISPMDHTLGNDGYDEIYKFYEDLYSKARRSVEKQLWTRPNMTTEEKLDAIAEYINTTAHYPGTPATDKEDNPEFWNKWAYDGVALYYDSFDRPYLNKIMKLHGGITTCVAANVLRDVAMKDLGLEYIYDSENKVVLDKEGVWIGMGEYSSNPAAGAHESCIYKDAAGNKTYFDAQGMFDTCAEHDCESRILDFSKGLN